MSLFSFYFSLVLVTAMAFSRLLLNQHLPVIRNLLFKIYLKYQVDYSPQFYTIQL